MKYTIISPLGTRKGYGTFDTFFNPASPLSFEELEQSGDYVVMNFVKDEDDIIWFEGFHYRDPANKKYHRLIVQHFPCGVDGLDADASYQMAKSLLQIVERDKE